MCCMTSDFANIGHTTTLVSELHRFLFPRELKQSQKSRSVIRGLKAGNSVLIITPGVPCVIAALEWFWFYYTTRICHVFNLRRKMTGDQVSTFHSGLYATSTMNMPVCHTNACAKIWINSFFPLPSSSVFTRQKMRKALFKFKAQILLFIEVKLRKFGSVYLRKSKMTFLES